MSTSEMAYIFNMLASVSHSDKILICRSQYFFFRFFSYYFAEGIATYYTVAF